jgi:hypothetical protein
MLLWFNIHLFPWPLFMRLLSVSTTEIKTLNGRRHENIEAIQAAATTEHTAIPKEVFASCFQDLPKRCQRCIDCLGGLLWRGQEPIVNKLNFVFLTNSVSEKYWQRLYFKITQISMATKFAIISSLSDNEEEQSLLKNWNSLQVRV